MNDKNGCNALTAKGCTSRAVSRRKFATMLGLAGAGAAAPALAHAGHPAPQPSNYANPVLGAGGHIHHVGLWTKYYDKSIEFYCKGLGFKLAYSAEPDPIRVAFLDSGTGLFIELFDNPELELHLSDESWLPLTKHAPEEWGSYLTSRGALFHFALRTHDVDRVFDNACAHGGRAVVPPMDSVLHSTNGEGSVANRWCYVEGPSGEWIELIRIGALPPR